jgi:hypothetical protein
VRREAFEQLPEWLDHRLAISLAIRVHPRLVVVPFEFAEEAKCSRCQDSCLWRYRRSPIADPAGQRILPEMPAADAVSISRLRSGLLLFRPTMIFPALKSGFHPDWLLRGRRSASTLCV